LSDDNSIDWTISDAPSDDEPADPSAAGSLKPPRPRKPRHSSPHRLSRRTGLLLGVVTVLALLLTAALPRWEAWRTRQAVEAVVAQQEQARLAGDWTALRQYYTAVPTDFATNQIVPISNGLFPAPIDLPGQRPGTQAGHVGQFQVLGSGLVRADVVRSIILADGTLTSFAMPQFYQFSAGAWRQVPAPDTGPEQALQLHGARVDVVYYPEDADLAMKLAHDLDALVVQACADWDCPADVRVPVRFDVNDYGWVDHPPPFDPLLGSLTLQTVFVHQGFYVWREIRLHSRLIGGYPADGVAAEAVRRAVGVQALLGVAQQMTARTQLPGGSSFIDALVVREGVRLGLELPGLSQLQIADPLYAPNDLWQLGVSDYFTEEAQHEALAMLNQILADRGVADERRLLHLLDAGAQDTQSWLAAGLGLTPVKAEARLKAALNPGFPAVQPPNFAPDLALSCPTGPMLATLARQAAPLLVGQFPDSFVESWSPDGQRLALTVSGRLSVFNLANATGQFLPQAIGSWNNPIAWASQTVLVYPPTHATLQIDPGTQLPQVSIASLGLFFFDSSDRQSTFIAGFQSYVASPDHTRAVITSNSRFPTTMLAVIPALDASSQLLMQGDEAAWSPDGQQLMFTRSDGTNISLHHLDLATSTDRTLQLTADPGGRLLPTGTTLYYVYPTPTWSSTGDWLALTVMTSFGNQYETWAGLIRPDGTGLRILPSASVGAAPSSAVFSADSRYLAVELQGDESSKGTAIYSVPDGALLRFIPRMNLAGWSPSGHILALAGPEGVSLLLEPGDLHASPQPFGAPGCSGVAWRPK
jgi:type II secretory pathway pseudopilin PulG